MSQYFPKPCRSFGGSVKVELDLSIYAIKAELKNATGIGASSFAKKTDLVNLKSDADKLDIDRLKNVPNNLNSLKSKVDKLEVDKKVPAPFNLSKLSDTVKNDVVKNDVYNAKIKIIEDKMPEITNLATYASLNAQIKKVEIEIPIITNLATIAALTTVENKIPNVSDLIKKADYDVKISEMESKYFATSDYNKFTSNTLDANITTKKKQFKAR